MKPWREIAIPHADVLKGTFLQSEFAADITAVHSGKAPAEYQDAKAFFERTYITEGMRLLLTQVVQRLSGKGGEPVIQLQTAFGGGKTHTMIAVLHLASRKYPLAESARHTGTDREGRAERRAAGPRGRDRRYRPTRRASRGSTVEQPSRRFGANWHGNSAVATASLCSRIPTPTAPRRARMCYGNSWKRSPRASC